MNQAVKIGTIFYSSWGYDQTNVDFYKVVGVTPSGKSVRIVKIGSKSNECDGPHDKMVPDPDFIAGSNFCANCRQSLHVCTDGSLVHSRWSEKHCSDYEGNQIEGKYATRPEVKPTLKRLNTSYRDEPVLSLTSYSNAYLWDGSPKYQTGLGYGH